MIEQQIIEAAKAICDNAANLPGGEFAQVDEQLISKLGELLYALSEQEQDQHGYYKNAAHVALERLSMNNEQLKLERVVDMADQLFLSAFDKVAAPGVHVISKQECEGVMFISQLAIANFLESLP